MSHGGYPVAGMRLAYLWWWQQCIRRVDGVIEMMNLVICVLLYVCMY